MLTINGLTHEVETDPRTPLLRFIREQCGLTGTKFGCGIAQCGACTIHLNRTGNYECYFQCNWNTYPATSN